MQSGIVLAIGVAASLALSPSDSKAQTDFVSLANKTCRGTFHVPGKASETGLGGMQHQFKLAGVTLTGHASRKFGTDVYDQLTAEVNSKTLSKDVTGFQSIGDILSITVDGKHVTYKAGNGAAYDLRFNGVELTGTVDPRGVPGQEKWVVSDVRMFCQ